MGSHNPSFGACCDLQKRRLLSICTLTVEITIVEHTFTVTTLSAVLSSSRGRRDGISRVLASHDKATSNLFNKLTMYLKTKPSIYHSFIITRNLPSVIVATQAGTLEHML